MPDESLAALLTVPVPHEDMATVDTLITLMQTEDPARSIDDCISEIFMSGLVAQAYRLIPSDTAGLDGEEHF